MSDTVVVALISSSASMLTAITTVIVVTVTQNRRFDDMNRRLDKIEADLREFFRLLTDYDKRLSKLEDKH